MANSKILKASIIIGGSVSGAFKGALSSVSSSLKQVGSAIVDVEKRRRALGADIEKFGKAGQNVDALKRQYTTLTEQVTSLSAAQRRLNAVEAATVRNRERLHALVGNLPGGHLLGTIASGAAVGEGLRAFAKINDAETDLRVALMDKSGGVPKQFEEIRKQAVQLHSVLPGTLADFHNVAVALKENGVSAEQIANGGLQAAAQLGVILKMPVEQAAEMTAKLRESFQLSETELGKMADLSQKARFGFGLKSDDLLLGAKYYGSSLNALGLHGAGAVRQVYALQGQAAQNGMDGSTFGTNFAILLQRAAQLPMALRRSSKEMANVRSILHRTHIDMQFFDKKGQFAGLDNFVAQVSKLRGLSEEQRLQVVGKLFGQEAGRVANLIATKGVAGYQAAEKVIDDQASATQRIDTITGSFDNRIKSLTGSIETLVGMAFKPLGDALIPIMARSSQYISSVLIPWVEHNQKLVGSITGVVTGLVALKTAATALSLVRVVAGGGILKVVGAIERMRAGAAVAELGEVAAAGGEVASTFGVVGEAIAGIASIGAAPIAAIVATIVAGGALVMRYWGKTKAFFGGVWQGIADVAKPVFADLGASLQQLGPPVMLLAHWAEEAFNWFVGLLPPVNNTAEGLGAAAAAGNKFGQAIGRALTFGLTVVSWLVNKFVQLGEAIGNGAGWLVVNFTAAWDKVKAVTATASDWIMAKLQPLINAGNYIGAKISGAANALGFGDGSNAAPSAPAAIGNAQGRQAPAMPTAGAGNGGGAVAVQQSNVYHITQQPGESSDALAKRIAAEHARAAAVKQRSSMTDLGT